MSRIIGRILKLLIWVMSLFLAFVLVNTFLHMKLRVCVRHLARFTNKEMTPIVYGYAMDDAFEKAKRGEIVLGGCVRGMFDAACPYCHWPSELVPGAQAKILPAASRSAGRQK